MLTLQTERCELLESDQAQDGYDCWSEMRIYRERGKSFPVSGCTETASQVGRSAGGDPVGLDLVVYPASDQKSNCFGMTFTHILTCGAVKALKKDIYIYTSMLVREQKLCETLR